MAQDQTTVSPGPGWVDFAGEARFDEASDVSLNIEDHRFGPATIASIKVHADGGVTDPGTYVETGIELTLGDARAIVAALQPIIRKAVLDGYDGYEGEDDLPERPDDWNLFEVAFCGQIGDTVERIDGREEYTDHDRYFWTVYGVHEPVEDSLGFQRPHEEPALALLDTEDRDDAITVALDLAQGRPVYLAENGSYNQVAIR